MALALNSENDIFAINGSIKRIYTGAQVVQSVRSRLLAYLGEWFLDTSAGVPYFESIFTKPADILETESILKATILQTVGVATLDSFFIDFDSLTRKLSVSFEATTVDGDAVNATVNTSA